MCAVFLLGMLPISAGAIKGHTIYAVTVSDLDYPVRYRKPDTDVTLDGSGWYSLNSIEWYDVTAGKYISNETDEYQIGHEYEAVIWLEASVGAAFSAIDDLTPDVEAKVNGQTVTACKAYEYKAWAMVELRYRFPAVPKQGWIHSVDLHPIAPQQGYPIKYYEIDRNEYKGVNGSGTGAYSRYGSSWWIGGTPVSAAQTQYFQHATAYRYEATLQPAEDYAFVAEPTVTVDGNPAYYDFRQSDDMGKYMYVSYTFPQLEHTESSWQASESAHCKVCTECGELLQEEGHIWSEDWASRDERGHARICTVCNAISQTLPHVPADAGALFCQDCGYEMYSMDNPFTDVTETDYFYTPILWAVGRGVTLGATATTFEPESVCTRAQVVTFLWRAMGWPEPTRTAETFADVKTEDYFFNAVQWAVEREITLGIGGNAFGSEDPCTRAQVVTFLWRTAGKPAPKGKDNPFKDVHGDDYFADAVLWAVENGITQGDGQADIFNPDGKCTRGQIVTFLYRYWNNESFEKTGPQIILEPQSPFYPEYSSAFYLVKVAGENLHVTWYLEWNGEIYNLCDSTNPDEPWENYAGASYGPTQNADGTFLYFFNGIEKELDGGYIWCVIEDGHYDAVSQKARISVGNPYSPPTILDVPAGLTVKQGEEAMIRCVAKAPEGTQLSYVWYETETGDIRDIRAIDRGDETCDFLICDTSRIGTRWYVCLVSSTGGGMTYSSIIPVTVTE